MIFDAFTRQHLRNWLAGYSVSYRREVKRWIFAAIRANPDVLLDWPALRETGRMLCADRFVGCAERI